MDYYVGDTVIDLHAKYSYQHIQEITKTLETIDDKSDI